MVAYAQVRFGYIYNCVHNKVLPYKNLLYGQIGLSRTMGLDLGARDPVWFL